MSTATFTNTANEKGEYVLPKLSFAYDALEPVIDKETVEIHYAKHHQTYVNNLNAAIAKHPELAKKSIEEILTDLNKVPDDIRTAIRNHGGGHANHSLFWKVIAPGGAKQPNGSLAKEIESAFGSFDAFVEKFSTVSVAHFGSGWGWLVIDGEGKLQVTSLPNQDSPYMQGHIPILGLDVWEHAYYLNYQNRRPDYVKAFWQIVNWTQVEENFRNARA